MIVANAAHEAIPFFCGFILLSLGACKAFAAVARFGGKREASDLER